MAAAPSTRAHSFGQTEINLDKYVSIASLDLVSFVNAFVSHYYHIYFSFPCETCLICLVVEKREQRNK